MKTKTLSRLVLITAFTSLLFACKKSSVDSNSSTMSNADLQTQSDDQTRVSTESDAAFTDVNTLMTDQSTLTGSSETPAIRSRVTTKGADTIKKILACDVVVSIDTTSNPHRFTVTYYVN